MLASLPPVPRGGIRRSFLVLAALVVYIGGGMFTLLVLLVNVTIRAVFPSVVVRPKMLGTKAGTNQKDSHVARCRAHRRLWQWHVPVGFAGVASRCVPWLQTGTDARHLGRFGPEEQERSLQPPQPPHSRLRQADAFVDFFEGQHAGARRTRCNGCRQGAA